MLALRSLRDYLHKSRALLGDEDVARIRWLFAAILAMAFLEVAGIASILPFMYLVSQPDAIQDNATLRWIYESAGFSSPRSMLMWAGGTVLVLFTASTLFTVYTNWLMTRTVWAIAHGVSMRVLRNYARLPYEYFVTHNSSTLLKKVLSDVNAFVSGVVSSSIRFVAYTILALSIFLFLLVAVPRVALAALAVFGGAYVLFHLSLHGYFKRLGAERLSVARDRFRTFAEAVTGIKAIRIQEAFPFFVERFETASERFSKLHPRFDIVAMLPRYAIELLAFGAIIGIVIFWLAKGEAFADKVPVLTLFALAAYRILPALNQASSSFARLSNNLPVIDEVHSDFHEDLLPETEGRSDPDNTLVFEQAIDLQRVGFRYRGAQAEVVSGIDIRISKGAKVGLVGATGSGKSTLMDIMVGLLLPVEGAFRVDGRPITKYNSAIWRRSLAYVPQDGFLYDDSLASNIAFGIPTEQIDMDAVRDAARMAQIDDFICNELPEGYATRVGERGIRLSGGQRQRVGLARAFYRRPQVLLLDEATSALDTVTEAAVMAAIHEEFPDLTVVMIAHRLSTVKLCDRLFLVDHGKVVASGSYEELRVSTPGFRRMVESTGQQHDAGDAAAVADLSSDTLRG